MTLEAPKHYQTKQTVTYSILIAVMLLLCLVVALEDVIGITQRVTILGAVLVSVVYYEWKQAGDPVTPMGIAACTGIFLFVLRPLTILNSRTTSPGASADTRNLGQQLEQNANTALTLVALFFIGLFAAYYMIRAGKDGRKGKTSDQTLEPSDSRIASRRSGRVLTLCSLLVLAVIAQLVVSLGGPAAYIEGLAYRSSFLEGRVFLTFLYLPLEVILVVHLVIRQTCVQGRLWDSSALLGGSALLLATASTGARGPILLGCLLPLLLIKQIGPRPFTAKMVAALGVAMVAIAVSLNILVRDSVYLGRSVFDDLKSDPVGEILARITSGSESRPFDSLIRLVEVSQQQRFELLGGQSYTWIPGWFVPRAVWEGKPFGGANTWFTTNFVPRFYGAERIETSISAVGEAFANFGILGPILTGLILGLAASRYSRSEILQGGLSRRVSAILFTPLIFSIIRGDSFQSISTAIAVLVFGAICTSWLSVRPSFDRKDIPKTMRLLEKSHASVDIARSEATL